MYLIVGLGNPGEKYQYTYHNLGFMCIDYISQMYNIPVNKIKHKALIGSGSIGNRKVILAKPQTYMNLSGESVKELAEWYKIPHECIIIIYDDINLKLGTIRIREKGSDGGHNGLKSVIYNLNTEKIPRIRIGIGQEKREVDLVDYVLTEIPDSQKEELFNSIKNACKAVEYIIEGNIQKAMNEFN